MDFVAALAWPVLGLVFAGVFAGLWHADRERMHLLGFAAGFFALFLSITVHLAMSSFDQMLITSALHGLACLSVIAIIWGAAKRLGQKIPLGAMLALTALSCVFLFLSLRSTDLFVALLVQNGTSGLLFGVGAVVLWTARSSDILDRILLGTISLLAAFSLIRPVVLVFLHIEMLPVIGREREIHAFSVMVLTVLTAILGGTLVAIAIKEAIELRHKAARIDPISGFVDQRTFEQSCNTSLNTAHRLEVPVSLAVLEFDRFTMLQDKWGKDAIERIIREICDVVRSWQRESDIIGRIGEHRLGILFVGVGANSAQSIVQTLRKDIDRNFNEAIGADLKFSLTVSIAQSTAGMDANALLRTALQPLGATQQLGPSLTFVDGVQTQLAPLVRPTDETFIPLG